MESPWVEPMEDVGPAGPVDSAAVTLAGEDGR